VDVVGAIADPVRREILTILRREARTAGSIAAEFDISRPAISRHLRILRENGLVHDEVRGRRRVYRLDVTPLAPLDAWLTELRAGSAAHRSPPGWEARLDALDTEVHRTRRDRRAARDAAGTPASTTASDSRQDPQERTA
jgi:DNA-binding transcriptional ArsR family regulator